VCLNRARRSSEGKNAMAHSTATLKIAPPSTAVGAPNTALPFTSHQSRVTIHRSSTRHGQSSRNARKLLRTNDGDSFYPAHFSTQNRPRRHPNSRSSTAPRGGASASCLWKRWALAQRKERVLTFFLSRCLTCAKSSVCSSILATSPFLNRAGLKTPALRLNLPNLPCGPWLAGVWTSVPQGRAQFLCGVPKTLRLLGRLIGTRERLEMNSSPSKSIALTLLIGTDLNTELHHFGSANCGAAKSASALWGSCTRKIRLRFGGGGPTIRLSRATWDEAKRGADAAVSSERSTTLGAVPRGQQREVFHEC
jgi:hypothetical protein